MRSTSSSLRAFTLIELLVVITIIAVLVGITLGVTGNVRQKAAVSRAQVEIAAIETALERYKIDNGDYPDAQAVSLSSGATFLPTTSAASNPSNYISEGRRLFTALMGRSKLQETNGSDAAVGSGLTQYMELKPSQVGAPTTNSYIQDPFGYAYGYYYNSVGIGGTSSAPTNQKSLFNQVVPDIWSTAGETGTISQSAGSAENARYLRWVTNWGSRQ